MAENENTGAAAHVIRFRCPNGHAIKASVKAAGKVISCPRNGCGVILTISPASTNSLGELRRNELRRSSGDADPDTAAMKIENPVSGVSHSEPPKRRPPRQTHTADSASKPISQEIAESPMTWIAPADLLDHSGNKLSEKLEFFVAPPQEMGTIISAHSTLKEGQQPMKNGH